MRELTIEIPESIPLEEARLELAVALYSAGRVTQGEAANLAGRTREDFIHALGSRGVSFTNIDAEDLAEELKTWRELRSRTAPH